MNIREIRSRVMHLANRLHYTAGHCRSLALRMAWCLVRRTQAGILHTKLRGVTVNQRQRLLSALAKQPAGSSRLALHREPENPADLNAVAVIARIRTWDGWKWFRIGYLSRDHAGWLAPLLDAGLKPRVELAGITGGPDTGLPFLSYGCNVRVIFRM